MTKCRLAPRWCGHRVPRLRPTTRSESYTTASVQLVGGAAQLATERRNKVHKTDEALDLGKAREGVNVVVAFILTAS